jgi:hypothetical protein
MPPTKRGQLRAVAGDGLARALAGNIAARKEALMFLLWILAVLIGIWGLVTLFRGQVLAGIALIIVAFLVGPGGVSVFT